MQKLIQSKKFLLLGIILISCLGGCKKNKKTSHDSDLMSSKKHGKVKHNKKNVKQDVDAFDLDQDALKTFALDDSLPSHKTTTKTVSSENPLFSWENVSAEESKHQFKTLYFEFDKDVLSAAQHSSLIFDEQEAKRMIKDGKMIVIEGHACHSAGSAIYNLALSERRARYIAQKFAEAGIDASNIKIAPRGQEMPVRKGGTKAEQWVNRRVEIYALDKSNK